MDAGTDNPESTPPQVAFLMRHLSDDDRARMIAEAAEKVVVIYPPEKRK